MKHIIPIDELNDTELNTVSGGDGSLVTGALAGMYTALSTVPGQEYNALCLKVILSGRKD